MPRSKLVERTHTVTGNILHDNQFYKEGDSITFGPEIDEDHILALLATGVLAGPVATKMRGDRIYNERESAMAGMTPEEQAEMWKSFIRITDEARKAQEIKESQTKESAAAQRTANSDEALASLKRAAQS